MKLSIREINLGREKRSAMKESLHHQKERTRERRAMESIELREQWVLHQQEKKGAHFSTDRDKRQN